MSRIDEIEALWAADPTLPPSKDQVRWLLSRCRRLEAVAEAARAADADRVGPRGAVSPQGIGRIRTMDALRATLGALDAEEKS